MSDTELSISHRVHSVEAITELQGDALRNLRAGAELASARIDRAIVGADMAQSSVAALKIHLFGDPSMQGDVGRLGALLEGQQRAEDQAVRILERVDQVGTRLDNEAMRRLSFRVSWGTAVTLAVSAVVAALAGALMSHVFFHL